METPYFSIIIPVYNTEKYLSRCLNSVLNQSYQSFEIITINDGSTDSSAAIISQYKCHNNKLLIIDQKNQGVSKARNSGLLIAKGEYILFLDSDDELMPNALNVLYLKSKDIKPDLCCFNGRLVFEDTNETYDEKDPDDYYEKGWTYFSKKVNSKRCIVFISIFLRIYRRSFLNENSIAFNEELLGSEDILFSTNVFYYSGKTISIDNIVYIYRIRQGSLVRTPSMRWIIDTAKVINHMNDLMLEKNDVDKTNIYKYAFSLYISLFNINNKKIPGYSHKKIKAVINNNHIFSICKSSKQKFLYILIRINPDLLILYKIIASKLIKRL